MATMRAWEVHPGEGADRLRLEQRPRPMPGPGEVLVRLRAASLNYRDLVIARTTGLVPPGRVPCSDGAGEVTAVGAGVEAWRPGDRVIGNFFQAWSNGPINEKVFASALGGAIDGTLCEYACLQQQGLVHLPESLSFAEGAALPCAALTAWNALVEVCRVQPGETVVLLGTGGVSVFALLFARLLGARTIVTSSSDDKLQRAAALGASDLVNYRTQDWDKEVWRLTDKRGADHVVEVGGAGTLPQSLRAVRVGGTVALVGILSGANTIDPMPILHKVINLRGVYVGSTAMFRNMLRAMELHQTRPVISDTYAFAQAPAAYEAMAAAQHFGKIVIEM